MSDDLILGLSCFGDVPADEQGHSLPRRRQPAADHRRCRRRGRERGFYAPTRAHYEAELNGGALFVGSPETVARKIVRVADQLRLDRSDLKYDIRGLPPTDRARTIELLGAVVAPRVQKLRAQSREPALR